MLGTSVFYCCLTNTWQALLSHHYLSSCLLCLTGMELTIFNAYIVKAVGETADMTIYAYFWESSGLETWIGPYLFDKFNQKTLNQKGNSGVTLSWHFVLFHNKLFLFALSTIYIKLAGWTQFIFLHSKCHSRLYDLTSCGNKGYCGKQTMRSK